MASYEITESEINGREYIKIAVPAGYSAEIFNNPKKRVYKGIQWVIIAVEKEEEE